MKDMNNQKIELNSVAYSELIRLCQMGKDFNRAMKLFTRMVQENKEVNDIVLNNLFGVFRVCQKKCRIDKICSST
eukprot:UN26385